MVHDVAYLPNGRTPLSTASCITPFIRTGAPHLHEAAVMLRAAYREIHAEGFN
ncbi:hypothetical protein QP944_04965 [Corynebacterium sp. MSK105]|uniref:hypothetical protein n=1 Tax=unclassified Corynebacterium TaxID=2624378 RepID=UPI00254D2A4C|nr:MULTISPECIES: hypothetical protein [unclassified Corynebacterium]MDK8482247.1 hypothetical protein [Corynebacterium sp. MSK074]MDK8689892.1 hypothetical protein [Corynebacterium sp. MSK105]